MFFIIQILTYNHNLQLLINEIDYDRNFKITEHTNLQVIPIFLLLLGVFFIGLEYWKYLKKIK